MLTVPNVSLAREASNPAVYLIVGDTKFWIVDPAEFDALGLQWAKIRVVDDGALAHLVEKRLHAPPVTRPSDVFYDCGGDFDSITGKFYSNCQGSASLVQRDVLVAGWLYRPEVPGEHELPFVNFPDPGNFGIEDIFYNLKLDAVFLDRMYGVNGLSTRLQNISYPGNPADAHPLPFAAGAPLVAGQPTTITYNSWILPSNLHDLHGELNAWHKDDTGGAFSRHFKGRGQPPANWVNPLPEDTGAYFPFHPLNPDNGPRNLRTGDYIVMRGPLWQDAYHGGDASAVLDPWDTGLTRHHAWLEMHPIDWVVRVEQPGPNIRLTRERTNLCTADITGPQKDWSATILPDFVSSASSRQLLVRTVERLDDFRMGMIVPGSLRGVQTNRQADRVDVSASVAPTGTSQGRFKASWLVGWSEIDVRDIVWVDDGLPPGSQAGGDGEGWTWVSVDPTPFHGAIAHQSARVPGMHQHYFSNAPATMTIKAGDELFAMVYLDPDNPPDEVMLQWRTTDWLHRAYWGSDLVGWGDPGTTERRSMGRLPFAGEWVRLEVPASAVGLEGKTVNGMAFTLWNGRATWDYAGVLSARSGHLAVSAHPSSVSQGNHSVTISTRDSGDQSLVAGRVFLAGQDIAATNTSFSRVYGPSGNLWFVVRCPGYPQVSVALKIGLPPDP